MRTSIVPTANEWHHVVVTYSGTKAKLYYDGERVASSSYTLPIAYSGGQYTLGHYNPFSDFGAFSGQIDELGIWSRVLTPDEVYNLYYRGVGNSYPFSKPVITQKTSKYNFQKVLGIPTYTFEKVTPQSILDLPFYIKSGR